jgi:YHS domain-containing protein
VDFNEMNLKDIGGYNDHEKVFFKTCCSLCRRPFYVVLGMTLNCPNLKKEVRKMAEKVRDLVCGMEFDQDSASYKIEYYDKVYYFCSLVCKEKFGREPEKYVNNTEREINGNAH